MIDAVAVVALHIVAAGVAVDVAVVVAAARRRLRGMHLLLCLLLEILERNLLRLQLNCMNFSFLDQVHGVYVSYRWQQFQSRYYHRPT